MPSSDTQFKPGQSGNPAGRPKGSRNKLSEAFIAALDKDFQENGELAIEMVRQGAPDKYLSIIGRLMPKLLELSGPDGDPVVTEVRRTLVRSNPRD